MWSNKACVTSLQKMLVSSSNSTGSLQSSNRSTRHTCMQNFTFGSLPTPLQPQFPYSTWRSRGPVFLCLGGLLPGRHLVVPGEWQRRRDGAAASEQGQQCQQCSAVCEAVKQHKILPASMCQYHCGWEIPQLAKRIWVLVVVGLCVSDRRVVKPFQTGIERQTHVHKDQLAGTLSTWLAQVSHPINVS